MMYDVYLIAAVVGVVLTIFILFILYAKSRTSAFEKLEEEGFKRDIALLLDRAMKSKSGGRPLRALVTGANSGLGFAVASTLAEANVRVIIGCRSAERGKDAINRIVRACPSADVHLLIIDVANPTSVLQAVKELEVGPLLQDSPKSSSAASSSTAARLDFLFLNAGIMPVASHRWDIPTLSFFTCRMAFFFETGRCSSRGSHFLQQPREKGGVGGGGRGACGAPELFATNVLGHALLAEECTKFLRAPASLAASSSTSASARVSLESRKSRPALAAEGNPASDYKGGVIVWSGSRASSAAMLRWESLELPATLVSKKDDKSSSSTAATATSTSATEDDPLIKNAHTETYGQAKYAIDLLNVAMSKQLKCPSVVICPGAIDSEMMPGIFKPMIPVFFCFRPWLRGFNVKPIRGAHAPLAAALHAPHLDAATKYVTWAGELVPAEAGIWPMEAKDVDRMHLLVQRWLALWRSECGIPEKKAKGGGGGGGEKGGAVVSAKPSGESKKRGRSSSRN